MPAFLRFNMDYSARSNSGASNYGVYSATSNTTVTFTKVNITKLECRSGSISYSFSGDNTGSGTLSAEQILDINNGTDGSFAVSMGGLSKSGSNWYGSGNCTFDIYF